MGIKFAKLAAEILATMSNFHDWHWRLLTLNVSVTDIYT